MTASDDRADRSGQACTVSVVIPNHNHGRFLPRCLASVRAQTKQPMEVVLIDDASTDDSVEIIERHSEGLPGFRLVRHDTNGGVIARINEGLGLASGSHVLFVAADDWIEPDLLAESCRLFDRYPQAGLCSALTRLADEDGAITGPFRTPLPLHTAGYIAPAEAKRQLASDDTWFNGNTTIVNRAAVIAAGGYQPQLASFCDGFLNARLACRHGACFIPRFLAVWRRMETGYAATVNVDPDRLCRIYQAVQDAATADGESVPRDYLNRWQARWRFSVARAALVAEPERLRERLLSLLPSIFQPLVRLLGPLARLSAIGYGGSTVLLFILLRFKDIAPVLQRRLQWRVRGRELEAQL
jgi:glycosyltransferase involved in cell wall biosynthesis